MAALTCTVRTGVGYVLLEDFPNGRDHNVLLMSIERNRALSIQQKKPVQDFGIFAGQMERVPELENHVRRLTINPGHA